MEKNKLAIGIAQLNPTVGDFEGNRAKILSYMDDAERHGVELLVFPELAVSGYPVWDLANKRQFVDAGLSCVSSIVKATQGKNLSVAVGFIDRGVSGTKSGNAIGVFKGGKEIHKQYKTLLPTYDVFLEEIFFAAETKHKIFRLNSVPIGCTICEDIWDDKYSTKPAQILSHRGARVLINISASPYHRQVGSVRTELLRRKARQYRMWIVYVNQVGGQDDLIFDGRSMVIDPNGKVRFRAPSFKEGLHRFDLDLGAKSGQREEVSCAGDEIEEMYAALCLGLKDYVMKNKFRKVGVGLSGGIDSALVAAIAADALGKDGVVGVAMPGPFSSPDSLRDAKALAENLGIEFRERVICDQYRHFIEAAVAEKKGRQSSAVEENKITLAMENLQARLRGLTMMYLSNDEGLLLLSTGNKSELAMGYCTLYGDMCGGLSVLGDVYKTDVYRLARYRNSLSKVIPDATITKAPTAELRPNQKDQDSLPPYEVLDAILERYVEGNEGFEEIKARLAKRKIAPEVIRRVISAVDHNEYKRRQLPPLLRVTEKAWFGRRMPITSRFQC